MRRRGGKKDEQLFASRRSFVSDKTSGFQATSPIFSLLFYSSFSFFLLNKRRPMGSCHQREFIPSAKVDRRCCGIYFDTGKGVCGDVIQQLPTASEDPRCHFSVCFPKITFDRLRAFFRVCRNTLANELKLLLQKKYQKFFSETNKLRRKVE